MVSFWCRAFLLPSRNCFSVYWVLVLSFLSYKVAGSVLIKFYQNKGNLVIWGSSDSPRVIAFFVVLYVYGLNPTSPHPPLSTYQKCNWCGFGLSLAYTKGRWGLVCFFFFSYLVSTFYFLFLESLVFLGKRLFRSSRSSTGNSL